MDQTRDYLFFGFVFACITMGWIFIVAQKNSSFPGHIRNALAYFSWNYLSLSLFLVSLLELFLAQRYLHGCRKVTGNINWNFFGHGKKFFMAIGNC